MQELLERCAVCGALIDEEDLFCANCGREAPGAQEGEGGRPPILEVKARNFACRGCGASMSYDAGAKALRCPFCASTDLEERAGNRIAEPQAILPFRVDRGALERAFRGWLGRGFFRPSDLARRARLTEITQIYVPFWVFSAETHTYWTADSSATPPGARGDWVPVAGERRGRHERVLVPASGALTPGEVDAVRPFPMEEAVPPAGVDLDNVTVEQLALSRKLARPRARRAIEERERKRCAAEVAGRARNVHVNALLHKPAGRPVLLPFWILAYRYKERIYRFVANGHTGRSTGRAPVSMAKILALIVIALVLGAGGLALVLGLVAH
ncbi:MAG: hypothetical protein ACE5GW_01185 [Planctomycetota bacterium]